jgi:hypothetical protein
MQQQQQAPQIDITATTEVLCECGNPSFKEVMYIRKESRLMSGLPEDRIVPIQLIACDKCGELLEAFIPVPLKPLYGKDANKSI